MKTENPNFALFAGLSKKEILELHIDFLDFQVRTYNVLTAYGIKIVKDLVTFEEHQILKFKNAGWKTLTDMVAKLADVDLHFGMTPNDIDKILNEENPKILAKLEEEKEKNKAASKNKFVNITIPEELSELPIESILLYSSHFDFNQKYGTIERLKNAFTTLGDIDGHSIESIYKISNIGKGVIKFINIWFEYFIPGSYSNISEKFDYYSDYPVLEIHSSPLLKKFINQFEIARLEDIKKLDEINFSELENWEKLCLLELRTLHTDGEAFSTNSNAKGELNFIRWIDDFIEKYCIEEWKKYLILKWNDDNVHLSDVAKIVGVTRERVRQIIRGKIKYLFGLFYVYDNNYTAKYFLDIIKNTLKPIKLKDIKKTSYKPKYNESYYLGFLNNIFPKVPFWGYNAKTFHNYKNTIEEIYSLAEIPNKLELMEFLSEKNIQEKLDVFTVMFISKYYIGRDGKIKNDNRTIDFAFKDEKIFINKTHVSLSSSLLSILETKDKPLSLDEICKILKQSDFYNKKVNKESVYNTLNRIDEIVTIDWHIWGLRRHISYQKQDWPRIQKVCINFLEKIGHQSGAGFIFKEARKNFPLLRSKYELVHIIRHSKGIIDLGFFNFGLTKWDINERVKIADVIKEIFNNDPSPKSKNFILENIRKIRTVRREGFSGIMRQLDISKYPPGYFGLKNRHKKNLYDLYKDLNYIEKHIKSLETDTSIESIAKYFAIDDNEKIVDKIDAIDSLKIIKDPFSEKLFVLKTLTSGEWSLYHKVKPIIRIILFNCTKPLTIEEIKYFFMGSPSKDREKWYRQHQKLEKVIIKIIKGDKNFDILPNGSILFTGYKETNIELIELRNEVIDYIISINEKIHIIELYDLFSSFSDLLNSSAELGYLLNSDDRIEIEENMVKLVDYD